MRVGPLKMLLAGCVCCVRLALDRVKFDFAYFNSSSYAEKETKKKAWKKCLSFCDVFFLALFIFKDVNWVP